MILFYILVVLQIADIYTTHFIISHGIGREINPVLVRIAGRVGLIPGLILLKVAFLALMYAAGPELPYTQAAIGLMCMLYSLVCLNNIRVILKAR